MSIRAVGWLQSKLGLDIGGRGADYDGSGHTDNFAAAELAGFTSTENCSPSTDPITSTGANGTSSGAEEGGLAKVASQWEAKLGRVWRQANEKATQFWHNNVRSGSNPNDLFGLNSGNAKGDGGGMNGVGDNPELDENGLPVTKNWYYFDTNLGRWTVSPEAPQHVQQEYYEQLEDAERERLGQKTVVPPPPPPSMGGAQQPPPPMNGGAPPPMMGPRAPSAGLFGAGGARASHGPQYAVPDYFVSAAPVPISPQLLYPGAHSPLQPSAKTQPNRLAAAPFPSPPTTAAAPGVKDMELSGHAALPYPPAVSARPPTLSVPQPVSGGSLSPSNWSLNVPHCVSSLSSQDAYGSSSHQPNALASPPSTNAHTLSQQSQPYGAYPPSQCSHNVHGSTSTYPTSNVPSFSPATPPTRATNSYATSTHLSNSSGISQPTQGNAVETPYVSAPSMPPSIAALSATSCHYAPATTNTNSTGGAPAVTHFSQPSAEQSQSVASHPSQPQRQQPAPSPSLSVPAPSNPFAQRLGVNPVAVAAPVTAPPPPTQTLAAPSPPNGSGQPSGTVAAADPAPVAARLPPPPSFKPFIPS